MKLFWSVAIGAALGGIARYYLGGLVQERFGSGFPAGTLVVNVVGSFILGFVLSMAMTPGAMSQSTQLLLTTGFCGGFTTFSAFTYETLALLQQGRIGRAAAYVGLSVGVALAAVFAGFTLGTRVAGPPRG